MRLGTNTQKAEYTYFSWLIWGENVSKEKIELDIYTIMQHMNIDEKKWEKVNQSPKVTINRQALVDLTKRTLNFGRRFII